MSGPCGTPQPRLSSSSSSLPTSVCRQPPHPSLSNHMICGAANHSRVSPSPAAPTPPQSCVRRHKQPHRARHHSRRSWRPGAPEAPTFGGREFAHIVLLASLISLGVVPACGLVAGRAATGSVQVRCNLSGAANNNNQAVCSNMQCTCTRKQLSGAANNNYKQQRPTTISSVIMMQPLMITLHIRHPLIFSIL